MSKFILIDTAGYVSHVEDTQQDGNWIEVSNDNVAERWWYNSDGTVSERRPVSIEEVRKIRNEKLQETDWMVLADSFFSAPDQSSALTAIKSYRQALRDFPDETTTYEEGLINWPELNY